MWAKNLSSRPPNLLYTELLTMRHAPVAQSTSAGESYCPLSFSSLLRMRPLQNGYPNLSRYPPAAPAYSNMSRSCQLCSFGAHAPHLGWLSIHSTNGSSQLSVTSMSELISTKYSLSICSNALLYPPVKPWFFSNSSVFTWGNSFFITSMLPSVEALSATTTSAPSTFSTERMRPGRNSLRNPSVFQLSITTAVLTSLLCFPKILAASCRIPPHLFLSSSFYLKAYFCSFSLRNLR